MNFTYDQFNPETDLLLERTIDVPPELVWEVWTKPEHLSKWFVPRPWTIVDCRLDLKPGGEFYTLMQSPEGQQYPNAGCFLEVVEGKKLVTTDTLGPGFRPSENPFFSAIVTFEPTPAGGTIYRAYAIHRTPENRQKHEDMGFHDGWGTCLTQMVEYAKTQRM